MRTVGWGRYTAIMRLSVSMRLLGGGEAAGRQWKLGPMVLACDDGHTRHEKEGIAQVRSVPAGMHGGGMAYAVEVMGRRKGQYR